MKKTVIAAVSVLIGLSLLLYGCGNAAGMKEHADNGIEKESRDMEEQQDAAGKTSTQESIKPDKREAVGESLDAEPENADSISFLGDSITTFRGYNPEGYAVFFPDSGEVSAVEETWWRRVTDELSLTLYANGSSSGATVVGDSTGTTDPACSCNELRTGALSGPEGACPESIIVYLGTNDMINGVPLGSNDGTTPVEEGIVTAFGDAYTLMLDKLRIKYPAAKIYCCTLLPVGIYGQDTPYVDYVNGDGLTTADYSRVIVQIAENKGFSVIDLQNCGITIDNLHEMTSDGVHPTPAGMACIAEAVGKTLAGE